MVLRLDSFLKMVNLIQSFIGEERATWKAFKLVLEGNRREENYEELVENLTEAYKNMVSNM